MINLLPRYHAEGKRYPSKPSACEFHLLVVPLICFFSILLRTNTLDALLFIELYLQAERDAANGVVQQGGALPQDMGPGLGFFPSLFALQFQSGAVLNPLQSARSNINIGPAEVQKLKYVDVTMKLLVALLLLFLILV